MLDRIKAGNILKDAWDLVHVQDWLDKWNTARDEWYAMRRLHGRDSQQAEAAYEKYLRTGLYEMPVLGSKIELLNWLLNSTAKPAK